jgi:hypothetical protein
MATQEVVYDRNVVEAEPDVVELALVGKPNALALFSDHGLDQILDRIRAEVAAHTPDISTERGRKAIASLARKVSSSKVRLDDLGKELVHEAKSQISAIDAERKRMRDELDKLRDDTRQPLTEWEDAESSRIKGHEDGLLALSSLANVPFGASAQDIAQRIESVKAYAPRDWQEFKRRYELASASTVESLTRLLNETRRRDEEQAELKRLKEAEVVRLQQERDARLQAEAAARAKAEAEAKAKAEAEAEDRRQQEFAAKAQREAEARIQKVRDDAAKALADAERKAAAERAEEERKAQAIAAAALREREASEKAQRDAEERTRQAEQAAARAARDAELAVERERQRIAEEKIREAAAIAKREANKKHVAAINNAATDALIALGVSEMLAVVVISAITNGEVPAVRISY